MLNADKLKTDLHKQKGIVRLEKAEQFLDSLPEDFKFDLVVTSPPYDIGKPYEKRIPFTDYTEWQKQIIKKVVDHLADNGSVCWQVGNHIENGCVRPLDIELAPAFFDLGLQLRNRIVWHFGHGLHSKRRFSGRHETILWFTKGEDYTFDLDAVRVPSKYPSKRHFKGVHKGELSGNPKGKNPEDVWDIPNVVGNHIEKTEHPCQFPVGLVQRLVLALSKPGDIVYDPFAGSASTAVAAILAGRYFIGTEIEKKYVKIARARITRTIAGEEKFRPADKPVYDHRLSNLSKRPKGWPDVV